MAESRNGQGISKPQGQVGAEIERAVTTQEQEVRLPVVLIILAAYLLIHENGSGVAIS
jgi:hypothetical protein